MAIGTVVCPNCGGRFSVDSGMSRRNVRCPHCGESIFLEGVDVKPSEESPPPRFIDRYLDGGNTENSVNAASGRGRASQSIDQVPKERSRVFLHMLLMIVVGILVFLCVQLSRLCEQMASQMADVNDKLVRVSDTLVGVSNKLDGVKGTLNAIQVRQSATEVRNNTGRIIDYKLINYTWEYPSLMESEFRTAITAGYEPAGYVCQNSLKGGFFLFVKRSK